MLALQVMPGITLTGSATDNAVVRFDGITGLKVQSSNITIADTGLMTLAQLDDSVGLKITGYDDKSSSYGLIHIDSSGNLNIDAKTSGNYLNLKGSYIDLDVANLVYIAGGALRIYDDVPIQFGTDADYSIGYNSADDTLRIADGGDLTTTPRIVMDSSGNVGIGTTSPQGLLELAGPSNPFIRVTDTTNTVQTDIFAQDTFAWIGTNSNHDVRFGTNGGTKAILTTDGNVGIGTMSPSEKLDILGKAILIGGDFSTATSRTNATIKFGRLLVPHYTNSEEPLLLMEGTSNATTGSVEIGGGTSAANAATSVVIYTASNNTTLTGTEIARFTATGLSLKSGGAYPSELLDVTGGNIRLQGDTGSGYGYSLYIEDELGANALRLYGDTGVGYIVSAGSMGLGSNTSFISISSYAGQSQFYNCGGTFTWRDVDDSNATRMSLDSATGALTLNSTAQNTINQTGNATGLLVNNDGTDHGIYIQQDGVLAPSKYTLQIYSDGIQVNSELVVVVQDNASSTANVMLINNDGTGSGLSIQQDGVLASSRYGLYVYSSAIQVNSPLSYFYQDNSSSTKNVLQIQNDGTGYGLYINQTGDNYAGYFYTNRDGHVAQFFNDGNNANRYGIQIMGGADDASGTTIYINCLDGDGDQVGYIENNSGTFQLVDASDIRLKRDIDDTTICGLDIIRDLRVVDFTRIKSGQKVIGGFIAQEVYKAYNPAVSWSGHDKDMMGLSPQRFFAPVIKAIQEVDDEVTILKKKVIKLEKEIKHLKAA